MPEIDVIVVGRGPAGLATAAVIARDGARVALVGPPPPAANDTRTAALFTGSMNLLQHIGARALLEPDITPLKGIRIVDDGPGLLHAPEVTFEAREIGLPDFGANVPQMPLVDALTRVAAGCAGLSVIDAAVTGIDVAAGMARVKLDNGDAIAAPLVAAADGRNSFCRSAVGIAADAWDYPQVAITAQFEHSRDHRGLSTEFHRPSGPCTVVPMPGLRSSLVWVERPAAARRLGDMDDAGFARALEERLHGILGTIGDIGVRRQFPLGCLKARSLGRTASRSSAKPATCCRRSAPRASTSDFAMPRPWPISYPRRGPRARTSAATGFWPGTTPPAAATSSCAPRPSTSSTAR